MDQRFIFYLPQRQAEALRGLKEGAGLPQAEILRRMIDHCCKENVLNELVPPMSGRISVGA